MNWGRGLLKESSQQIFFELPNDSKIGQKLENYIRPEQSANVLFNFMRKLQYLKEILSNKAMIPRYNEEWIGYIGINGLSRIAFPMTCFCDIFLNKLIPHMSSYGSYGIGLDKKWGIDQGIQPIHYVNPNSNFKMEFQEVFSNSFHSRLNEVPENMKRYNNYLLTNLLFMKPIEGKMFRNTIYEHCNFHDEKEWRFLPDMNNIETNLPMLIPQHLMNPTAYSSYSDGIRKCEKLWLKFDYISIKYLIVETVQDRRDLIQFIMKDIDAEPNEKYILISKILVFDELKEDW